MSTRRSCRSPATSRSHQVQTLQHMLSQGAASIAPARDPQEGGLQLRFCANHARKGCAAHLHKPPEVGQRQPHRDDQRRRTAALRRGMMGWGRHRVQYHMPLAGPGPGTAALPMAGRAEHALLTCPPLHARTARQQPAAYCLPEARHSPPAASPPNYALTSSTGLITGPVMRWHTARSVSESGLASEVSTSASRKSALQARTDPQLL